MLHEKQLISKQKPWKL